MTRRESLLREALVACAMSLAAIACDANSSPGSLRVEPSSRLVPRVVPPRQIEPTVRPAALVPARVLVPPIVSPDVRGPVQIDAFAQEPAVVDILWIVDNSASLSNERDELARHFDRFLAILLSADVDFHVGVTSTDLVSARADGGRLRGEPRFIDRNTRDPAGVFRRALAFPIDTGIRLEEGLAAMTRALGPELSIGANAGFLRDDAGLAVIVVSDEDDGSLGRTGQYVRFLESRKGAGREVNVALSAVVGEAPDGCVSPGDEGIFGAEADAGLRYIEVARATGGLVESVCSPDFAPFVEELATALAGLRRYFPLSAPPVPNTIVVRVDGRILANDASRGWTYDDVRRGISFAGTYIPPPGADLRVEYHVAI